MIGTELTCSANQDGHKTGSWSRSPREQIVWGEARAALTEPLWCFMTLRHNDGHVNVLAVWGQLPIFGEGASELNTHWVYLYVYSLSLFGCLGNEDASGGWAQRAAYIRHEIEMEEVQQQGNDFLPILHHAHTHLNAWWHAVLRALGVCVCVWVCVCICVEVVCVCLQICQMSTFWSPWLRDSIEGGMQIRGKDESSSHGVKIHPVPSHWLRFHIQHREEGEEQQENKIYIEEEYTCNVLFRRSLSLGYKAQMWLKCWSKWIKMFQL